MRMGKSSLGQQWLDQREGERKRKLGSHVFLLPFHALHGYVSHPCPTCRYNRDNLLALSLSLSSISMTMFDDIDLSSSIFIDLVFLPAALILEHSLLITSLSFFSIRRVFFPCWCRVRAVRAGVLMLRQWVNLCLYISSKKWPTMFHTFTLCSDGALPVRQREKNTDGWWSFAFAPPRFVFISSWPAKYRGKKKANGNKGIDGPIYCAGQRQNGHDADRGGVKNISAVDKGEYINYFFLCFFLVVCLVCLREYSFEGGERSDIEVMEYYHSPLSRERKRGDEWW